MGHVVWHVVVEHKYGLEYVTIPHLPVMEMIVRAMISKRNHVLLAIAVLVRLCNIISCVYVFVCVYTIIKFKILHIKYNSISLSMIVLNSRDWPKKRHLKFICLQNPPYDSYYPINSTKIHWYNYYKTIPLSNAEKTQIFHSVR